MDLGEHSWSTVKREVSSNPGSPSEQSCVHGERRDELRTSPLDAAGSRRVDTRPLHSYAAFCHPVSSDDVPLFADLDQAAKLGVHKTGIVVDPGDMYSTLAAYESPSAAYMHSSPNSPVYVPTSRVGPMIPSLPYLQPSAAASQPSHAVSSHAAWSQPTPESPSAYSTGSPHATSTRFHYSPSPPVNNGTARDSSYPTTLNAGGREQYLSRPLSGSYTGPYAPYVGAQLPQLPTAWPAGPFDNSMLHSLQSRAAPLSIRPGPAGTEYTLFVCKDAILKNGSNNHAKSGQSSKNNYILKRKINNVLVKS